MSSHQGHLEVPAWGVGVGEGLQQELDDSSSPGEKSGHSGKIKSTSSRLLLQLGFRSRSLATREFCKGVDPKVLCKHSYPSPFAPALALLKSLTIKCPGSTGGRNLLHEVGIKAYGEDNLQEILWFQV